MTYSVYNIKVDNQLLFTPGPTAGYVLAINSDGTTYWSQGGSGGGSGATGANGSSGTSGISGTSGTSGVDGSSGTSPNQNLQQTLSLGNNPGTYSIEGQYEAFPGDIIRYGKISAPGTPAGMTTDSRLMILHSTQSNFRPNGAISMMNSGSAQPFSGITLDNSSLQMGVISSNAASSIVMDSNNANVRGVSVQVTSNTNLSLNQGQYTTNPGGTTYSLPQSISMTDNSIQMRVGGLWNNGGSEAPSNVTIGTNSISLYAGQGPFYSSGKGQITLDGDVIIGITSSVLATDANGRIIATSSASGSSGTSGVSGSAGSSGTSGTSPQLSSQMNFKTKSLLTVGAIDQGEMAGIGFTFSASSVGSIRVDIISDATVNSASDTYSVQLRYGTGTAPTTGSAETGTVVATITQWYANTSFRLSYPLSEIVSGLNTNTVYWFDLSLNDGPGQITFRNIEAQAIELAGAIGATGPAGSGGGGAATIGFSADGGGSVISTGLKGYTEVPYSGTITGWTMLPDQSGSCVVDIWKTDYTGAPPTVANTITGSAKPTLTSANKAQSSTLTGWTTTVNAGDIIAFNVDSATTITKMNFILKINRL